MKFATAYPSGSVPGLQSKTVSVPPVVFSSSLAIFGHSVDGLSIRVGPRLGSRRLTSGQRQGEGIFAGEGGGQQGLSSFCEHLLCNWESWAFTDIVAAIWALYIGKCVSIVTLL
jgi:hypothetical protein